MSSSSIRLALAASVLSLAVGTGCDGCDKTYTPPKLWATLAPRTSAPPGAITEYVEDRKLETRSIRITEGVAMALECRDEKGAPCLLDGSASNDDTVVSWKKAYGDLDQTVAYGRRSTTQTAYLNRALFVVVGRKVGNAKLTVSTGEGPVTIDVTVFPAK